MVMPAPRENPELIGHEAAELNLLASWNGGRFPPAWIIGGIAGIGKATLAFRFARFALAQGGAGESGMDGGQGLDLFGAPKPVESLYLPAEHPVFRRVRAGGHADLLTIERQFDEKRGKMKTDIAVDDVREVSSFLRRTTSEGGWRVVIVDGVDQMNASGHNALLKILEEPPPCAMLLLVTEAPGGLLPTIRSRCRKLLLNPLSEAVVLTLLERGRPDLPPEDRTALARLSEGSIGRALNLAGAGGLDLYRKMIGLLGTLPHLNVKAAHAFSEAVTRKGDDTGYRTTTDLMLWWLARLVRAQACRVLPEDVVAGEGALISRLSAAGGLDRWLEVWENTSQLFARAESANLDRKQVVLNALLGFEAATS